MSHGKSPISVTSHPAQSAAWTANSIPKNPWFYLQYWKLLMVLLLQLNGYFITPDSSTAIGAPPSQLNVFLIRHSIHRLLGNSPSFSVCCFKGFHCRLTPVSKDRNGPGRSSQALGSAASGGGGLCPRFAAPEPLSPLKSPFRGMFQCHINKFIILHVKCVSRFAHFIFLDSTMSSWKNQTHPVFVFFGGILFTAHVLAIDTPTGPALALGCP